MSKIKIISNPYQKKIAYHRWNEALQQWILVDMENNGNSKLLSDVLRLYLKVQRTNTKIFKKFAR